MYSFKTRVRYSECNSKNQASLTALLDYLQDCCTFHSEDLGIGVGYLSGIHAAWILSSWQVDVLRYPALGERLEVFTWPYEIKDFYGMRNFKIEDESGEMILKADSIWVFIDTSSGRPMRPPELVVEKYAPEPKLDMEYLGRKLPRLPEGEERLTIKTPHYFIDTNNHVNNAKYILMCEELLPYGFHVNRIRAEYKKSAVLGDMIRAYASAGPDSVCARLVDDAGASYANVIFYGEKGK